MKLNKNWFRSITYIAAPNLFITSALTLFDVSHTTLGMVSLMVSWALGIFTGIYYPLLDFKAEGE